MRISRTKKFLAIGALTAVTVASAAFAAGTALASTSAAQPGTLYYCAKGHMAVTKELTSISTAPCPSGESWYYTKGNSTATTTTVQNPYTPQFGVGQVLVQRGSGTAAPWETVSADLASPAPSAAGTFRFTCSASQAPCTVSARAYATASGTEAYPRILLERDDTVGGSVGYCEYADGVDNNAPFSAAVSTSSSSPTSLTLGVGGSLDCNEPNAASLTPIAGDGYVVTGIEVPAGYYDVSTTFFFKAA